ncbi:DUF4339 domain-containing protein [Verrucomicrobiales bacterium BCK34]|nr:DUF4339 domain-containing protein [Verrucomicrobiales bacterium BCK34]
MPAALYYLNSENQPVGPMNLESIRRLVTAEVIDKDVLVCEEGKEEWLPLARFDDGETKSAGPPLVPPPPRAAPSPTLTAAETDSSPYPEWLPLVSLAAGILSLLTLSLPLIGFLLAVAAIAVGYLVLKQVNPPGKGFALTGAITGALSLLALLFVMLGGGNEVASIEDALAEGIQISQKAARQFPDSASQQAKFVAYELQKVDTRGAPPEFRIAYQRNVDAWETAIPYFEANNPAVWFLEGFFGGLSNDYSAVGFSDYQARGAAQNIDGTYRELRTIAVAYGARIPTP